MSIIHKALQKLQKENTLKESMTQISLKPRNKKVVVIIGVSVLMVCASFAIYVTQFEPSKKPLPKTYTKPLPQEKDSATLSAEGIDAYKKGDITKSIELFQKALEKNDADHLLHNNIGLAYLKQNDTKNAEIHFEKALSLTKDCFECSNNLGLAKVRLEKFTEAHTHFSDALTLNKNYADAYFNQGVLFEREGNIEEAVSNYTQFVFLSPKEHEAIIEPIKAYRFWYDCP